MTTPTTQREADEVERAICEAYPVAAQSLGEVEDRAIEMRGFRKGFAAARAAIDQTDAKTRADAHTTSYHQGYLAGIEMGKALAADEAAATDQPSAGRVDERALFEAWSRDTDQGYASLKGTDAPGGWYYFEDDAEAAWAAWQARASLTPTAPAEPLLMQRAPTGEREAIESAIRLVETHVKPRRCDSPAVSECAHCNTVYLASVLKRLLATPTAPQAASQQAENQPLKVFAYVSDIVKKEIADALASDFAPQAATTASTAPVQAAQPALPVEPVARLERVVGVNGKAEVVVFRESMLKVGTLFYAAPGAAQTTDAREGGAK